MGVLLHVTALPGGSFGAGAQQWLQLLSRHRVGVWQVLPLAPTDGTGSPYSSPVALPSIQRCWISRILCRHGQSRAPRITANGAASSAIGCKTMRASWCCGRALSSSLGGSGRSLLPGDPRRFCVSWTAMKPCD